jgi:hypothetical protein
MKARQVLVSTALFAAAAAAFAGQPYAGEFPVAQPDFTPSSVSRAVVQAEAKVSAIDAGDVSRVVVSAPASNLSREEVRTAARAAMRAGHGPAAGDLM